MNVVWAVLCFRHFTFLVHSSISLLFYYHVCMIGFWFQTGVHLLFCFALLSLNLLLGSIALQEAMHIFIHIRPDQGELRGVCGGIECTNIRKQTHVSPIQSILCVFSESHIEMFIVSWLLNAYDAVFGRFHCVRSNDWLNAKFAETIASTYIMFNNI